MAAHYVEIMSIRRASSLIGLTLDWLLSEKDVPGDVSQELRDAKQVLSEVDNFSIRYIVKVRLSGQLGFTTECIFPENGLGIAISYAKWVIKNSDLTQEVNVTDFNTREIIYYNNKKGEENAK